MAKREGPDPAFIILGGQKCGTTLLYECLNQHPLVIEAGTHKTHFFDWAWQPHLKTVQQQRDFYMTFFDREHLERDPSIVTGESSPSYILRGDLVIPRLKEVAGQTRLLVMLRDPVKRAYSHYHMTLDPNGTPAQLEFRGGGDWPSMTFEQVVDAEEAELAKANVDVKTSPSEFAKDYLASRPSGYGGHSLLGRGLYALQLQPWLEAFGPEQIKVFFLEEMTQTEDSLQETMDVVFEHIGLPPSQLVDKAPKNKRDYAPMDEGMERRLRDFYAPYDDALKQLLGRESLPWSPAVGKSEVA